MSSSRLILIFLAFIFLIIIILSSARIGNALRSRLGKIIPPLRITSVTPTPTPSPKPTATPTPSYSMDKNNKIQGSRNGTPTSQIPATGPSEVAYLLISGSFFTGIALKKFSRSSSR